MQVTGATQAAPVSGEVSVDARRGLNMGYDAFIKLLLAQLKNQDPTKPMDATEYVSQLATLSNLEQVVKQSEKLDQLLTQSSIEQGASLIGMRITSKQSGETGTIKAVEILSNDVYALIEGDKRIRVSDGITLAMP